MRLRCDTPLHARYQAAAVFWVLVFPVGVPCLFLALLQIYKVHHLRPAVVHCAAQKRLV